MELSGGGEVAAKRADLSSSVADAGHDRLSELPDDILVLILSRIPTLEAGKTSILSHRWRRVWALLPELCFALAPQSDRIRDALDAHGGALRALSVGTQNASAESVAAWLTVAARRLSGRLTFCNVPPRPKDESEHDEARVQRGAFELPCFESATSVSLKLGFLGLSVPPAGVFARLTQLYMSHVEFRAPCELGDAVSSPRCPCLQMLRISATLGLNKLAINSESLLGMELEDLEALQQLTIVAPALKYLRVARCLQDQPVACISAPQLERLEWKVPYDPSSVQLGEMEHVHELQTTYFVVYGPHNFRKNHSCLRLLQHFKIVKSLFLTLIYLPELHYYLYFMDAMTMLPDTTNLHLHVMANGHAFGASLFHVLRTCSGIRRLIIGLNIVEEQTACQSDCICRLQAHWKTEELLLNCLQEVEITDFGVSEHEATFMKRLFIWAIALQKLTVTFYRAVTASKAKEFCQMIRSFSRPGICMEFYICNDMNKVAAERADLSSSPADDGQDRLSELPDDILVLILRRIGTLAAGQTRILSRRWRRVWALLPELCFAFAPQPDRIRDALDAHGGDLRSLSVATRDASPEAVAAWLTAAARRLSGRLIYYNAAPRPRAASEDSEGRVQRGGFELPCFESATAVSIQLGFLGLSVPPAGIFGRLTELSLSHVRFDAPCELGDAVSSPRCPRLQKLCVSDANGLNKLAINSESLLHLDLDGVDDLRQLTIVAPVLQCLKVASCFHDQPIACISAPQLGRLEWSDPYDPSTVHLGEMDQVQYLQTSPFIVYGPHNFPDNHYCLRLLQHFKLVEILVLTLVYFGELLDYQYFMDDMMMLPDTKSLHLHVIATGHAFGASLFHVLRMCSGIRKLILNLDRPDMEEQKACPSDCICRQQANWKTEELLLNCLQEVEITDLGVSEHEVTFIKHLFIWATALKKLKVTFDRTITEREAKEFCQMLLSFSGPEICTKFYICNGILGMNKVLYVP
ncbi:hypothetical protein EJB05_15000, partial [Eragrostis curvula]